MIHDYYNENRQGKEKFRKTIMQVSQEHSNVTNKALSNKNKKQKVKLKKILFKHQIKYATNYDLY